MASPSGNVGDRDLIADLLQNYSARILEELLKDRSTGANIVWGSDEYKHLGSDYFMFAQITVDKISGPRSGIIVPRVAKDKRKRTWRTKEKAEVFTPSWLCAKMCDGLDEAFLDQEPAEFSYPPKTEKLAAGGIHREWDKLAISNLWQKYVDSCILEITCGEAPFICSPYDATTGCFLPVLERIGFLDRKLLTVKKFTQNYGDWLKWSFRALQSTYGYEYQGDNLLIARLNVFNTWGDYMEDAWNKRPNEREALKAAKIIAWNIWQMDGLTGLVPSAAKSSDAQLPQSNSSTLDAPPSQPGEHPCTRPQNHTCPTNEPHGKSEQLSCLQAQHHIRTNNNPQSQPEQPPHSCLPVQCLIYDWRSRKAQTYNSLKA